LVRQTIAINVVVLFLDFSMLACEYANLYAYQIMLKCAVYSVKLKLEFYILNLILFYSNLTKLNTKLNFKVF